MRPNRPIYLDHHATTPMDPRVLAHYGGDIRLAALGPRDARMHAALPAESG